MFLYKKSIETTYKKTAIVYNIVVQIEMAPAVSGSTPVPQRMSIKASCRTATKAATGETLGRRTGG
jgi:hypothetical protein